MTLERHLPELLGGVAPLEPLDLTLAEARGCQLADDVVAPRPLPHFPLCTRAGYAVRTADVAAGATALKVVDRVAPGYTSTQAVYAGVCIWVEAGAPVPRGADAVVPGTENGDVASVTGPVPVGAGISPAGSTAAEGAVLLKAGSQIDPRSVGVLAMLGSQRVTVRPQPRVVIVTVGSGLVHIGAPVTDGLLFDAAGPFLAAATDDAGALAFRVGPIDEEPRLVRNTLEDQLIRSDLLVVCGGSDHSGRVVREYLTGLRTVSYDDGSTSLGSFGHGTIGEENVPVLSLPDDPVRAAMLFTVLAVPIIRAMRGVAPPAPVSLTLATDVDRWESVTRLLLVRSPDGRTAEPVATADPTLLDLASADAIIRILPGTGVQPAGSAVPAMPLVAAGVP